MTTLRQQTSAASIVDHLVRAANIEVIPLKGADEAVAALPAETTVTITCSPKFGLERTLQHAEAAVRTGHRVVPHLAARQVQSADELVAFLDRIRAAGITDLYVVGGDAEQAAGPYRDAGDLLEAIVDSAVRPERIGVGCYPEGHPNIGRDALRRALERKQRHADYMVSQLCFDSGALVGWLRATRADGVTLPLRIGLAAPLKTSKLIELSLRIGVGPSVRFLSKQHGIVSNLVLGRAYQPEQLLYEIGEALADPALDVEGLHLFSFNQVAATAEWQRRVSGTAQ
ncbi:MAG: methylenetetrahydrofolate reductase [Solirubrobacteraceae bacterium]